MICMKELRFSSRPRTKVRCQGPLGSARALPCKGYDEKFPFNRRYSRYSTDKLPVFCRSTHHIAYHIATANNNSRFVLFILNPIGISLQILCFALKKKNTQLKQQQQQRSHLTAKGSRMEKHLNSKKKRTNKQKQTLLKYHQTTLRMLIKKFKQIFI